MRIVIAFLISSFLVVMLTSCRRPEAFRPPREIPVVAAARLGLPSDVELSMDDAGRRFWLEPGINLFLKSTGAEADSWLEGYTGGAQGQMRPRKSHLSSTDSLLRPDAAGGEPVLKYAWNTAPVPANRLDSNVTFLWAARLSPKPPKEPFILLVNGTEEFVLPLKSENSWDLQSTNGSRLRFDVIWMDHDKTRSGYMRLTLPATKLKAGKAVRLEIRGTRADRKSFPALFQHVDAATWLRSTPRVGAFVLPWVSMDSANPIRYRVAARAGWHGLKVELLQNERVLDQATLKPGRRFSKATLIVPLDKPETFSGPLTLRVNGKPVGRPPAIPQLLLTHWHKVARKVRWGNLPAIKHRSAAMVLACGQHVSALLSGDSDRSFDVKKRAGSLPKALKALETALADYEMPGDMYAKRRGGFHTAYISTADRSGQIYNLYVPPDYNAEKKYPLRVTLHGHTAWYGKPKNPAQPLDFFSARCDGRGQNLHTGLGELDILEVIRDVRKHYNIEPDRIYVSGHSMGGRATWQMCTRYPDLFAAGLPKAGYATAWEPPLYLENLFNVPIWNYHDDTDYVVAVGHARVAMARLASLGYPMIYTETSGAGHGIAKSYSDLLAWKWRQQQIRNPFPTYVSYTTASPDRGRAYWTQILEFTNPNHPATLRARAHHQVVANQVFLQTVNIDVLALDIPEKLFDRKRDLLVSFGTAPIRVKAPLPDRVYFSRGAGAKTCGTWQYNASDPRKVKPFRRYTTAGMNSMYISGEPLLIVKGTGGGDARLIAAIDNFCHMLSHRAASWWVMPLGEIPVKADSDVTDEDIRRHNLILVGSVSANSILARITARLPATETNGVLKISGEKYSLKGRGYGLFHYNPEAPERLVLVLSAPEAGPFYKRFENGAANRISYERPYGLVLNDMSPRRSVRRISWGKDWCPTKEAFVAERLPADFARAGTAHELEIKAVLKATGSDLIFHFPPRKTKDPAWDVTHARWHDLANEMVAPKDVYVSVISGKELIAVRDALTEKKESFSLWPPRHAKRILPGGTYKVCMYPRGLWWGYVAKLKKNLPNIGWVQVDRYAEMRRMVSQREKRSK
jgi:pimeloyl-ACP methyl ester carboxylesterase